MNQIRYFLAIWIGMGAIQPALTQEFSMSLNVMEGACPSAGSIFVNVSGGSGDYTYSLENTCSGEILPQSTPEFTSLSACTYRVTVTDRMTNRQAIATAEVAVSYEPLTISRTNEDCEIVVEVNGGSGPFEFYYSDRNDANSYVPNNPITSNRIFGFTGERIYLKVVDACGATQLLDRVPYENQIRDIDLQAVFGAMRLEAEGGSGPYEFEIRNEKGTHTLTGNAVELSFQQLGCLNKVSVTDRCGDVYEDEFELMPRAVVECINYASGTAELRPTQGSGPFLFIAETSDGTHESNDGTFTNLPVNGRFYNFYIQDACGNRELVSYTTRYSPDFFPASGCQDETLTFDFQRHCSGPIYFPIQVQCLSCPDTQEQSLRDYADEVVFTGSTPGNWSFAFEDDCGDRARCSDAIELEVTPACDSAIVNIISLFNCDNGVTSRREMQLESAMIEIYDETGVKLGERIGPGTFRNLSEGAYKVRAILPACDSQETDFVIASPVEINPYFETYPRIWEVDGTCVLRYNLRLEKRQGPFVICGGPSGEYVKVLNNYKNDICRFYTVSGLLPGVYTIRSMSRCGSKVIELPENDFGIEAELVRACPSGAKIMVDGALSAMEWREWYEPFDLNLELEEDEYEGGYSTTQTSMRLASGEYFFYGQPQGKLLVYHYALGNSYCPVDTVALDVPPYVPLSLEIEGAILCDNTAEGRLKFEIGGGEPRFMIQEMMEINSVLVFEDTIRSFELPEVPVAPTPICGSRRLRRSGFK